MMFDDTPTITTNIIKTGASGTFSLGMMVSGCDSCATIGRQHIMVEEHANPQHMKIRATSDGYSDTNYTIQVTETNLHYNLEIEMD